MTSLKTFQSLSGLYFGAFTAMHLANHALFLAGDAGGKVARHREAMRALRTVYQHPLAEGLLAVSVMVHGVIAMIEYQRRNDPANAKDSTKGWRQFLTSWKRLTSSQNLHRLTGWILMLQVPVHVFSTRIDQYLHGIENGDVQAVVMAVRTAPLVMFPYLVVLASIGAYHAVSGGVRAVNQLSGRLLIKQQGWKYALLTATTAVLATTVAVAVAGVSLPSPLLDFYFPIGPPQLLRSMAHWPAFITQQVLIGYDEVLEGTRRWGGGMNLYFFKIVW